MHEEKEKYAIIINGYTDFRIPLIKITRLTQGNK